MSGTVRGEIWLLGGSVCTGIALMMMYDGLRIFRWLVRHGSFWTGMEDAAYWLFASFATFRLLFGQNDGVLRGYAVAGVPPWAYAWARMRARRSSAGVAGMALYSSLPSTGALAS